MGNRNQEPYIIVAFAFSDIEFCSAAIKKSKTLPDIAKSYARTIIDGASAGMKTVVADEIHVSIFY